MAPLEMKHFAILGGFLISLGTAIGGLEHGWHDAITPGFIGGMLGQVGTLILAIYVGAPGQKALATVPIAADDRIDPKRFTQVGMLLLCLGLPLGVTGLVVTPACASHAPATATPEAKRAYQVQQVVTRLGELQATVIELQQKGVVRTADAREIVTLISGDVRHDPPITGIVEVLHQAPAGWTLVVTHGWQTLSVYLSRYPDLQTWLPILDQLVADLTAGGQ